MGCKICKSKTVNESAIQKHDSDTPNNIHPITIRSSPEPSVKDKDITIIIPDANDHIEVHVIDPDAFNNSLVQQRQRAIDNLSYRSAIESLKPNSLQQLVDAIKTLSKGKSSVDCHWIIFYWIACNIEYDTVSYFSKDYKDQSAEGVFRTKKGVCAGYANLYKYLCDQLQMPCEVVSGYSKGYGFDDREGAPSETDHAWNAVEIHHHWYLMESTWGTGHLNKQKVFERKLNSYYFLPRPNEMIYHHLPEDYKWQLLKMPITMNQYLQMPKVYPTYFELNLELVSPLNQAHVDLLPDKPYALVVLRAPSDVNLIANLKLNSEKVDGGHRVTFNKEKQLHYCYFAPSRLGKHKITIYGRRGVTESGTHYEVLELTLDVKQMPKNPISFPETWKKFADLSLEVISPKDTHLIKLLNGAANTEIHVRTPIDVLLCGHLESDKGENITGGDLIYYDRRKKIWRCKFAPNRNGLFEALIMAKKMSDPGYYSSAVSFKIEAKQIPSPPISYPYTWSFFHDFGLKIKAPKNRANAVWSDNASYAEVLIQAPDDIQLTCNIEYKNVQIENGSLAQFDNEKKLWRLLFAPERTGPHELVVYAKRNNDKESSLNAVVKFNLDVTKLKRPMKFPLIYTQFQSKKCQIYTPMDGIFKKGSVVPIHCFIPGATDVKLTVDSNWLESEGYTDPILQRQITVGSKEVNIYAKYGQKPSYDGLVKYTVQ